MSAEGRPIPTLHRRLLAGGAWVVAGKFVTAAATLLAGALLTRLLPPADVGVYFLADRLVWLVSFLALLGLNTTVVRLVAEAIGRNEPGQARGVVRVVQRWALCGVLCATAFLALGGGAWLATAVWRSERLAGLMVLVAVWAALHSLQVLASETFRGFQDLKLATLFGGVVTGALALPALGALLLAGVPVGLTHVILILAGSAAVSQLAAQVLLRRKLVALGPAVPVAPARVFRISVPLWINGLLAYGFTQSDVLILAMFRGPDEVAVYGAAARLVSLVLMSLMLVNLIVPPFIAELHARGERARLERMLRGTATLAGLPALVVLALYLAFGPFLLERVYGPDYRGGWVVLAVLSFGRLINVLAGSGAITLSMTGHERKLMRITAVSTMVTVLAALAAVRPLGSTGVASAICAGVVLQAVWVWLEARRATGMWTHVTLIRPAEVLAWLRRGA